MEDKPFNSEYQQITEEFKKEIKIYFETSDKESTTQNLSDALNAVLRGKQYSNIYNYSNTSLPQETRKTLNNLTLHQKQLDKEE